MTTSHPMNTLALVSPVMQGICIWGEGPSPTPPHKGEGLNLQLRRTLNGGEESATSFLPPCGGDGRQAREGLSPHAIALPVRTKLRGLNDVIG